MKRRFICAAALALAATTAARATGTDITASIVEAYHPGGYVYTNDQTIPGTFITPKQSAELLYLPGRGFNLSGRSTNLSGAFASALAESDGNGGVGVSSWLAGPGSPTDPQATDQLAAQAIWRSTFTYLGSEPADIRLHIEVPTLTIGLVGVAPNRSGPSKTETAQATASVASIINHADGTTTQGKGIDLQLSAEEYQYLLGPNNWANFADVRFNGDWSRVIPTYSFNGDAYNPQWTIKPFKTDVSLGTLSFGDSVSWVYTLLASGTTLGYEHGYYAFLGDPFRLETVVGNLVVGAAPVPEPRAWALMAAGLAWLGWQRRRRHQL